MLPEPKGITNEKSDRDVRAAFDIKSITPEERAENFREASKLVKAYERQLRKTMGYPRVTDLFIINSD